MKGYSVGYKRDISDQSNPEWCIYRSKHGYIVAKVESRMDDAVIPFVEPAHGPLKYMSDAWRVYANPPASHHDDVKDSTSTGEFEMKADILFAIGCDKITFDALRHVEQHGGIITPIENLPITVVALPGASITSRVGTSEREDISIDFAGGTLRLHLSTLNLADSSLELMSSNRGDTPDDDTEEDRLERQAQAHLEAAARHRDDPMF